MSATSQNPNQGQSGGYDASGNIANDGLNSYLYDGEGRICAMASTPVAGYTTMTEYIYDAEGNRVAKGTISTWSCDTTVNGFVATTAYVLGPHGEQLTEMTSNGGTWQWAHTNVMAGGLDATYDNDLTGQTEGKLYFHLSDWLGTRRQQTDYAGSPVLNFTGLPFGDGLTTIPDTTTDAADATEHHFTGHERDAESGNDYFGARYYSNQMGRFMTPDWSAKEDPVPYAKLGNPQSLNLYAYMDNNPLGGVDPDGHDGSGNPIWNAYNTFMADMQALLSRNAQDEQLLAQEDLADSMAAWQAQQQNMDKVAMSAETAAIKPTRESVKNGNYHEYGGLILERDSDGHIISTKPIAGQERTVDVDSIHVPKGYTVVGEYHTHPHATADEGKGPSPADIYRLRTPERASRVGYVVDSYSGAVYRYTQNEPVRGPYDTRVYGTPIGTIP
jgi:RHS repeat-associated protein